MRKILLLFVLIISASTAKAFYYNGLYYYPSFTSAECELRGFDPNFTIPTNYNLVIPSYAYDESGNAYEVTCIANRAFAGYGQIDNLVIPGNVKEIGAEAFTSCIGLKECILYPSTTTIGSNAFENCINLRVLTTNAEVIGHHAFNGCISLNVVNLGAPMKTIGSGAFMGCSELTYIDIPHTVEELGQEGNGVFEDCIAMLGVTFSYNLSDKKPRLKSIGANTFKNCINLPRLDFPYSVKSIGSDAFLRCTSLKHLEWGGPEELTVSYVDYTGVPISRIVFHGNVNVRDYNVLQSLQYLVEVRYDTYATTIQRDAFKGIATLKSVHLDKITSINPCAFEGCIGLSDLTLSPELEGISYNAFKNCTSLKRVDIPANVKYIGSSAFADCQNIQEISFHENLETIEQSAFANCKSIESIVFPMSLTSLASSALEGCSGLKKLTLGGPTTLRYPIHTTLNIEDLTLRGNITGRLGSLPLKFVRFTDFSTIVESETFLGCSKLSDVDFGNIQTIKINAFKGCSSLSSIDLSNVESIASYAFADCTNLKNVKFGNKITNIPDCLSNTGITSLHIPDNVTYFTSPSNCQALETVIIGDGINQCIDGFKGCNSLKDIYFGELINNLSVAPSSLRTVRCANPIPAKAYFHNEIFSKCELIIPIGASEAYRAANVWKNFYKITEVDFSGVNPVTNDSIDPVIYTENGYLDIQSPNDTTIYGLDGRIVMTLSAGNHRIEFQRGIYIVSTGPTSRKIILH